jgi:hypothetical protein
LNREDSRLELHINPCGFILDRGGMPMKVYIDEEEPVCPSTSIFRHSHGKLFVFVASFILTFLFSFHMDVAAQTVPVVATDSSSGIEATIGTLYGIFSPNGSRTTVHFDYGPSGSYGSTSIYDTVDARTNALYFDGSSSSASIGGLSNINLLGSSFSIEAWAKRYPDGSDEFIFSYGVNPATDQLLQFGFRDSSSGNVFTFGFYNDDLSTPVGYTDTLWHQWVGVYDYGANKRYIYRDGILVASDSPGGLFEGSNTAYVGFANFGSHGYFKGDIAEVSLWNTALSQSTIQQWMYRSITSSHPNYGNLIGYWKMNQDTGSVVYDSSSEGNKLFLHSTEWASPDWTSGFASQLSGLSGGTTYHYRISATNSSGTTTGNDSTFMTLPGAPSQAATNLNFSDVGEYSATIQWTNGNGQDRLVLLKQASSLDGTNVPTNGTMYSADTLFAKGSEVGNKSYVVYAGTSNSVMVTGLVGGRTYIAAVYELNDLSIQPQYQTVSPAEGTCVTTAPLTLVPATSTGTATNIVANSATLNGTLSTNNGQTVFGFNYGPTSGYGYRSSTDTIDDHSSALLFNATDSDKVVVPSGIDLGTLDVGSFTIMAWAKRYPNAGSNIILGQGAFTITDAVLQFGFRDSTSGNVFTFAFYNDDLNTPAGYTDTLWHFWVGVFNSSTYTRSIYRDGVLVASDTPTGVLGYQGSPQAIVIGANSYSNSGYFNGEISQVTILHGALTQSQILQWMYRKASPSLPDDGNLQGEWIFNEGSGVTAGDSSGNGRDATINGATWTASDWPESVPIQITGLSKGTTYHYRSYATNYAGTTNGSDVTFTTYFPQYYTKPGYALHFDGSSSYVDVQNSSNASQFNFTGAFTIEGWFKTDSSFGSGWESIINKGDNSWRIQRYNQTHNLDFGTTGLSVQDLQGSTTVDDKKWHFFAAVYDGSRKILYVDGRVDADTAVTGTLSNESVDVTFANNLDASGRMFSGDIDEVRIWDVARTEQQVRSDMFSTIYNTASGLIDYWQFNEGTGTTTADSVSDFNGELVNSPAWVISGTPVGGYASFDAAASADSAGQSGSTIMASITSPVDSLNFLGLYSYGSSSDTAVTTETFPSGVTERSPVIWGVFAVGEDTANITFNYSGITGVESLSGLHVLEREDADSPWVDVTSKFTQNTSTHTFTETGVDSFSQFAIGAGTDNSLPVQASDFVATANVGSVSLTWKTRSEVNNAGFNVLREDPNTSSFKLIASYMTDDSLRGLGTSSTGRSYDFTDNRVASGATYDYKIQSVSTNGTTKDLSTISVTVDVPKTYALYQNYPNPFNPTTVIGYQLSAVSHVTLKVYDVLGREVATLVDGQQNAGVYKVSFDGSRFASGVYFYRINAVGNSVKGGSASGGDGQKFVSIKKLVLMK